MTIHKTTIQNKKTQWLKVTSLAICTAMLLPQMSHAAPAPKLDLVLIVDQLAPSLKL